MPASYVQCKTTDEFGRFCSGSEPDILARLLRAYQQARERSCAVPDVPPNPARRTLHDETA